MKYQLTVNRLPHWFLFLSLFFLYSHLTAQTPPPGSEPDEPPGSSSTPLNPQFNEPAPSGDENEDESASVPTATATPPTIRETPSPLTPPSTSPPRPSVSPRVPAPTPARQAKPMTEKERFAQRIQSFDFQNAEITDVIRAISQLTGKNFILDPAVKGRISIIAPSEVTVEQAYRAFLSALAINSYTVVPSGKFLKIMPARSAQRDSIETLSNGSAPSSDQMVTRIISLKYLNVADILRYLRNLPSRDGDLMGYDPTNSLIISDYGSNIRRIMKILDELDRPGFEERLSVIPIRYARAKDLAALIDKIINKGGPSGGAATTTGFGPISTRRPASFGGGSDGKPEALSLVTPDERTNSLIVAGNQEGIDKVKLLVEELDFSMDPGVGGGVFVYRLKHSNAENLEKTLTGLATRTATAPTGTPSATRPFTPPGAEQSIFGGDIKVIAEKSTNSLIITASSQDFEVVKGLLAKIDIPRDQVYVEAIIMEVNTDRTRDWRVVNYYLDPESKGLGRAGFSSAGSLAGVLNPAGDSGVVLGFGRGQKFTFQFGDQSLEIPSLLSFINFLQQHTDANILSTPQILALDNEEAMIEVGDQVPIGVETQLTQSGISTSSPKFDKATIKLTITPHISPESGTIRLAVAQSVKQASKATVQSQILNNIATILSDRSLKTSIVVNNGDTVVLGGLIRDEETHTQTKIPFLGDIPVLGWLFKSDSVQKKKVNLMVFLTPRIIRNPSEGRRLLGDKLDERERWMSRNSDGREPAHETLEALRKSSLPQPEPSPTPGEIEREDPNILPPH